MKQSIFKITSNEKIARDIFKMTLAGDTSAITAPGQFVNIKLDGFFLRRPISVCDCVEENLTLIYKTVGHGTEQMSRMENGDELDLLTGLGNGYNTKKSGGSPLLVGGGVGVPPMYMLCRELISEGKNVTVVLGFNSKDDVFYENEFRALGADVHIATADGTYGIKGFVTDVIKDMQYTFFYTCGPDVPRDAQNHENARAIQLRGAHGLRIRRVHGLLMQDTHGQQEDLQRGSRNGKRGDNMGRLSVNLCGEELDNPVIPASGTFGYGYEFAELYDINCLGTFSFKGTTKEPRFGNPTPRIAECTAGMINAVGLQNPGVDKVISEELPRLKKCFNKKVMANVSGFSVDEYAYTCEKLDSQEQVGWLEVNVSCPNVHGGGMSFGTDPKAAAQVTKAVKAVTKKPVIIKLSPNVTDIVSIAKACEDAGADGISLINTLLGMRIDLRTKKPVIANTMGGFSGSAIFPVALRMVYQVSSAVNIPVVGMGGVSSAEDVIEMMLAGATAVEIGAANLVDPFICKKIVEALPAAADKYNINELKDIIGGAHNG